MVLPEIWSYPMEKMFKNFALGASVCGLAFTFSACDSSSSGTSSDGFDPSDADFIEETYDDLPVCSSKREGRTAYVKDSQKAYSCQKSEWVEETFNEEKGKSSEKNSEVSSSSKGNSSNSKKDDSNKDKSSSSEEAKSNSSGKSNFNYGTLTDSRDGKKYKTIKIGSQNWMAENLNFDYSKGSAKSFCYEDKSSNCESFGRLYTWAAAMDSAAEFSSNGKESSSGRGCGGGKQCFVFGTIRGVCPEGWHLPHPTELEKFFEAVGGKDDAGVKLKSTSGWVGGETENGKDSYGFNVLPSGSRSEKGSYQDSAYYGSLWTSNESADWYAESWYFKNANDYVVTGTSEKSSARSVRCVEDTVVNVKFDYGTFEDSRDGQVYKTIKIGKQTWMAENLNYKYEGGKGKSYCYDDDTAKCASYGRLYDWAATLDLEDVDGEVEDGEALHKGVCPKDWHLPTKVEVATLLDAVGGSDNAGVMLKSTTGWWNGGEMNGTDDFGFFALPGGSRSEYDSYNDMGYYGTFWSFEIVNHRYQPVGWYFKNVNDYAVQGGGGYSSSTGHSVRCVKN